MGLHRDDSTATQTSPGPGPRGEPAPSIGLGSTLDHFEVLELLGAGGFGEVYRARDTRLGRMVAIKVLPEDFARDSERRERFRREAMAASALNHPNICTVYEFVEVNGRHLIVMELVEGKTLQAVAANGPLPVAECLPIALQILDALAEAHRAGILHRDIKSGNIALTGRGHVKVLDFGLAKLFGPAPEKAGGSTLEKLTAEGTTIGTPGYMSPEQLLGRPLDGRSDLFSFGVVLYEMVTGQIPFQESNAVAVADAILHAEPRDFGDGPLPGKLESIIRKLLEKDPARRYASAEDVRAELKVLEASLAPARRAGLSGNALVAVAVVLLVAAAAAGWLWRRASRERWVLGTATPEIVRLVEAQEFPKAATLIREARAILPKDPTLERLWMRATEEVSVRSEPPDADVSIRPYRADANSWENLGKTPLEKVRLPINEYVWRIAKPGFAAQQMIWAGSPKVQSCRLDPEGSVPADMVRVRVPGGQADLSIPGLDHLPGVPLDDYLIDRTEVTNEEYGKFVDAGGYQKRDFWTQPFVKDGRTIPWQEAVALLRDSTGRPGPATWDAGRFPKGLEKHPVAGVSWYEAVAYAEYAGKSLPTIYHWNLASNPEAAGLIVNGSNFLGGGTQPVGRPGALSGFGTSDMAGNVKEWCWNEGKAGKRYILGGGYGEPAYMFVEGDAQSPWDRGPNYGFRCVKLASPLSAPVAARVEAAFRDFSKERPVSDEVLNAFKGLYAYDKGELNARVEETETTENGTREKVSFSAAYGGERVVAHLCLPRNVAPPFQTVVFFPGSAALFIEKFDPSWFVDHPIVKSGRALMVPIYKSTFERRDGLKSDYPQPTAYWRDHMILWSKDLGRSLDYLRTRKDVDGAKLAYLGSSWGGVIAPVLLAVDERFKAAILWSGGLAFTSALPAADPINFVPSVRIPVLMINGRYDAFFPVESSQLPLFRGLGTPDKDKRHVIFESGHTPPAKETTRESLDWLDKYLGPVKR